MDIDNLVTTRGIVLSEEKYRESSKIINLFTEKFGRINIFASGVLRPKSGMLLVTEKFAESEFILSKSKGNFYIKSANLMNSNLELGFHIQNYFIAEMICEIILKTIPEHFVEEKVYNLTSQALEYLKDDKADPTLIKMGYLLKYISFIGFRPQLQECVECQSKDYSNMYFSNSDGGVICGNCLDNNGEYVKLSKIEIEIMLQLLYSKFSDYHNLKFSDTLIEKLDNIIYYYMLYNTELSGLESQRRFEKLAGI